VPVWHSSDLDSAPQNLLETAEKLTLYKKRGSAKKAGSSLGLLVHSLVFDCSAHLKCTV